MLCDDSGVLHLAPRVIIAVDTDVLIRSFFGGGGGVAGEILSHRARCMHAYANSFLTKFSDER